jgi:hypothetical protein
MLNDYNRYTFFGKIKFKHQIPNQLSLLKKYKKLLRRSRRIKDSWKFLLDPKVSTEFKIRKLVFGLDLHLNHSKTDRFLFWFWGLTRPPKTVEDFKRSLEFVPVWEYDDYQLINRKSFRSMHGKNLKWHFEYWAHPN